MKRRIFMLMLAGLFTLGLAACDQDGPAEEAGEKIDNSIEKAGEKLEEMGDTIRDKTDS